MTAPASSQAIDLPSDQQPVEVLQGLFCPYCGRRTRHCDSAAVYGRSYGMIYFCAPCKAWVGTHKGGWDRGFALGRLANAELRAWKQAAHAHFDPLWRMSKRRKRRQNAYAWLAGQMGLPVGRTHNAMLNVEQCKEVVRHCRQLVESLKSEPQPGSRPSVPA